MGLGNQQRLVELESATLTPGSSQSLVYKIFGLPRNRRVAAHVFMLDADYLTVGGGNTSLGNSLLSQLVQFVEHHSDFQNVKATGLTLLDLYHHMNGKADSDETVTTMTTPGAPFRAWLEIPCADPRAIDPYEGAIPTECLNGTTVEIVTSTFTGPNTGTIQNATLRHYLVLTDPAVDGLAADPLRSRITFEDWGGQTIETRPGVYSHAYLAHADGSPITIGIGADIERVDLEFEGNPVIDNVRAELLVQDFNHKHVGGGFVDNDREQLDPQSVPFLPFMTPETRYKVSQLPAAATAEGKLTFEGTDTAARVVYRIYEQKGNNAYRRAAAAQGVTGNVVRVPDTANKVPLNTSTPKGKLLKHVLPGKLIGTGR